MVFNHDDDGPLVNGQILLGIPVLLLTEGIIESVGSPDLGAEVIEFPTIDIKFTTEGTDLQDAIDSIQEYDWLIFTRHVYVVGYIKLSAIT